MIPPIRFLWAEPRFQSGPLDIRGVAVREPMKPGLVNRPGGTGDRLLMFFHRPVFLSDADGHAERPPGTLMLWPSGSGHHYGHPRRSWLHSWVHCDGILLERLARQNRVPENRAIQGYPAARFDEWVRQLHRELERPGGGDGVILENLFENFFRELRRHLAPAPRAHPALERAKRHVDLHFLEPISVEGLARLSGCSAPHLGALWRAQFGGSPIQYAIKLRLANACYLLLDRNVSIGSAAERSGFDDLYYFSRLFKKHLGASPRAWRQAQNGA